MNQPADLLRAHREAEGDGSMFRRDVNDPLIAQIVEIALSNSASVRAGLEARQPEVDRLRAQVAELTEANRVLKELIAQLDGTLPAHLGEGIAR